jgi:Fuc2NAc and GlcNAc transferase
MVATAFLASALLVRIVRDVAVRRAVLDRPNERSSHAVPRPRIGGIGVVVPVLLLGVVLVAVGAAPPVMLVALGCVAFVAGVGLMDDLRPLPARWRFMAQFAAASVVVVTFSNRLPAAAAAFGTVLPVPVLAGLAVLWIVWLTNLYNFMDGIDGIAAGQALIASLALASVASSVGAGTSGWLLLALAGSSAGFLLYNFPPSSIFMGDVGSTAVGFFFGVLPLLPDARPVPLEPVAIALSLFVLDATTTLVRRIARGEPWATPHRTHLYQRPVVLGATHGAVLLIASAGMVIVAKCATEWGNASPPTRLVLLAVPVALFVTGQVLVWRMGVKS